MNIYIITFFGLNCPINQWDQGLNAKGVDVGLWRKYSFRIFRYLISPTVSLMKTSFRVYLWEIKKAAGDWKVKAKDLIAY